MYEEPFKKLKDASFDSRTTNREARTAKKWWLLRRSGSEFREKTKKLGAIIVTPLVAKYRLFQIFENKYVADTRVVTIFRDDHVCFGILSSSFHTEWSLANCQYHGVGNDPVYTHETTLETFPFPEGLTPNIPAKKYAKDPRAKRIAQAAKKLDELRRNWLNPPDLVVIEPEVVPGYPDRILPKDAHAAAILKTRTLTNLYNERPQWLVAAHAELDRAVAAAYGWQEDITTEDALAKLLELNLARAKAQTKASR
jgi:type II restriction/modification system DNA methylase subunit YeeA